ncbi:MULTISPECIES: 50S ribosomal protein L29 [Nitrosomonas]|uniref:Large ribosomal subunit protein uL29 n=1 Tax=Nitrosomonas eutropha TaxID=916 RepID=A0ABX5MBX6_9PROT|nr:MULTISPECIES: 50S ribosomal protein L29 [Nitrosomonas]MXS79731.1 50S ribosomal protein L29 [Nitrosomonas sp. GH22]PXV80580.1 LSU ribosomal protein L29P [Nitrosomonas eutropha]SCX04372.1 LSU ribosomal protein L29P [Nitrosomonas eutropha]SDW45140.1 LSU ribosomal protein L29P [Nitrosomonas eutropha]SEI87378.1 LSU ribosomal protein L29P [Nitrosomonas eutropha]
MKVIELKGKGLPDLEKELLSLRRIQFGLRFQLKTQQLTDTSQVKKVRRDIARIKTIIREKEDGDEFRQSK